MSSNNQFKYQKLADLPDPVKQIAFVIEGELLKNEEKSASLAKKLKEFNTTEAPKLKIQREATLKSLKSASISLCQVEN